MRVHGRPLTVIETGKRVDHADVIRGLVKKTALEIAGGSDSGDPALSAWSSLATIHSFGAAALDDGSLARLRLLKCIALHGGSTLADVARELRCTPGNLTGLVDRASRDGLVERLPDPSDRRCWRVRLTQDGRAALQEAERQLEDRMRGLFSGVSDAELATLAILLDRACAHMVRVAK